MKDKRWVVYTHENALTCPCCGDVILVETRLNQKDIDKNLYLDGDLVQCADDDCDLENGQICCDEESVFVDGEW